MKKIKHFQKILVNNMAYSRISLNHIQQKTDLLTIAVIRKRSRFTVSIFVVVFYLFSFSLKKTYLGTF